MVDTTAPSVPTGLAIIPPATSTVVPLGWYPTADDTVVTAYDVYNGATLLGSVTPTNTWTLRNLPAANTWGNIAYGDGILIMVTASGSTSVFASSRDGINWALGSIPLTYWSGVTYGNGMFVAVASNTTTSYGAVYSTDKGLTWTKGNIGTNYWSSVTYGNGLFVAIAGAGQSTAVASTSPDGLTWTTRTLPVTAQWNSVTYGNGLFVAVAGTTTAGNIAATSLDGITWTQRTLSSSQCWQSVAYGNGMFVAVAGYTANNVVSSSPNGITWTSRTLPTSTQWGAVAYSNGLFVAVGSSVTVSAVSTDGITWTSRTITSAPWGGVFGLNGFFIAVRSGAANGGLSTLDYSPTPRYTAAISQGNNYSFNVKARDAAGNVSGASAAVIYNNGGADIFAPDAPTGLAITGTPTGTTVPLGWCPTNDDVVVTAYDVYNGTTLLGSITPTNTWTQRALPVSTNWSSVTYGNGLFVAVSATSIAASSPDGITWTQRTLPVSASWASVTYGNGLFVAVAGAASTVAASSPDGITWTQRTLPTSTYWGSVIYGNGMFVTVAGAGNITTIAASSPDGVTWTQRVLPSGTWYGVTYGNGTFVAVANTTVAATSVDGMTWTARTMPVSAQWFSVTYGNGTFVAISYNNSIAATSLDGITWTQRALPVSAQWYSVTYGNGLFVAVAQGPSTISATSPDGITWTQRTLPVSASWRTVASANGFFAALAVASATAATFDYTPTPRYTAAISQGNNYSFNVKARDAAGNVGSASTAVVYNTTPDQPTGLAIVGTTTPTSVPLGWYPTNDDVVVTAYDVYNGTTLLGSVTSTNKWTERVLPVSGQWQSSTYSNGLFVSVSSVGAITSPDGITWTQRTMPAGSWIPVTYGNGTFVAVAYNSTSAATSPDGITWTQRSMTPVAAANWISAAYGNGTFVAVASGGTAAATSPDGVTWTARTLPVSSSWNSVTFGNGVFVAVSSTTGTIAATSFDGITWTQRTLPQSTGWQAITFGKGSFVAVSNSNYAAYSSDGITWSTGILPSSTTWNSVGYSNGMFMAVAGNTSTTSLNGGANWGSSYNTPGAAASWTAVTGVNGFFVTLSASSTRSATFDYSPTPRYTAAITQGTDYNFNVKARDAGGFSGSASTAIVYNTTPSAPTNLAGTPSGATVPLSWNPAADDVVVTAYDVYNGTTLLGSVVPTNTWTQQSMPNATWQSVAYGNGIFVAVAGAPSNIAATSPDGITWTQRVLPASSYWISVTYGNGVFVAVAGGSTATSAAATSSDGITWTIRTLPASTYWISVTYGNGTFVAVSGGSGNTSSIAATSPDGITWTQRTLPYAINWRSVTYGNGTFVTVSYASSIAATSTDGIAWTGRSLPVSTQWWSITYGNGTFVAISYNSSIAVTSPDGATWTQRALPASTFWYSVTYGNGLFVAVSSTTTISATSPDGITWTQRSLPSGQQWTSVASANGFFAAVSSGASSATFDYAPTPRYTAPYDIYTTYNYNVKARDAAGISSPASNVLSFISQDSTPPAVPIITASNVGSTVTVSWNTDSDVALYEVFRDTVSQGTTALTTFSQTVPADGSYSYTVRAQDAAGNWSAQSSARSVTVDTTAPSVPAGVTAAQNAPGSRVVNLSWTASTGTPTGYRVYRDGSSVKTVGAVTSTTDTPPADGTFVYTVSATDAASNESAQSTGSSITIDITPPSVPTGVTATQNATGSRVVNLSWTASTGSPTGYKVYRGGSLVATVGTVTSTTDTPPADGTFIYTVSAVDTANNESAQSGSSTVTLDTAPPTVPVPTASASGTTVTVSWTAISDATLYEVFRDAVSQGTTASITFSQTGVAEGTYSYTVRARDAAGNWSAQSTGRSVTVDITPPTTPGKPSASNITPTSVTLTWTPPTDLVGIVAYDIYDGATLIGTVTGNPPTPSFTAPL